MCYFICRPIREDRPVFYLSRIFMNWSRIIHELLYCWRMKNKPERLARTQTRMIIPVYIGPNKRSAEGTKDLSPLQGFWVVGAQYRGWYPRLWSFAPSGLSARTNLNTYHKFVYCWRKKSWRKSEEEMKRVQGKAHVVRVRAKRGIEGVRGTERVYSSPAI